MDRSLQRSLLEDLRTGFPAWTDVQSRCAEDPTVAKALIYLDAHELVELMRSDFSSGEIVVAAAKITHKGLDFIADDGGLSAILGVVTVKLHHDTLMWLVEQRIAAAPIPPPEKQRLIGRLRSLSIDATKHLALKLVEKGLAQIPDVSQLLEMLDSLGGPELLGG